MKISVIVPVYKCEAFLPDCLDSILSQTHTDLQIILVDDGSPDESGAICDQYAAKDSRITVLHQENQGVSAARNAGLACAHGDAVTFVDSDDTIDEDMYETLASLLQDADVAVCGYKKIFFDGSHKEVLGTGEKRMMDGKEASRCVLVGEHFTGSPWTKLYRRELFENIKFDTSLKINEDILMNIELFQKCSKIAFWDVCKYNYFERSQSATRITNHLKIKRDCVDAATKMLSIFRGTELEDVCAGRLRYALIDLYREWLFYSPPSTRAQRKELHTQYRAITKKCKHRNMRMSLNYRFMRHLPGLYTFVYRAYGKLHTPNVDI